MNDTLTLSRNLRDLLRREHAALADFLVALAAFDRERRWLELGHSSLFYFLHRELGLSKGAAFYRKTAAELVHRLPEVIDPLRDGRLCLTSVVELSKVITPENRAEVLPRFFHASKREAQAVAAELRPVEAAPHREVVTVPRPAPAARSTPSGVGSPLVPAEKGAAAAPHVPVHLANQPPSADLSTPSPAPRHADVIEPLTGDLRRFHVTVSKRFLQKLAAAKDALSHSHPGASTDEVLEAALDLLLEKKGRQKGLVKKPRSAPPRASDRPRHIPAAVRRAVWVRDGGRCQHPVASGGICGSTRRLELDHVVPVALGGKSTVENLRITCQLHNQLAARRAFGNAWMDRFAPGTPAPRRAESPP